MLTKEKSNQKRKSVNNQNNSSFYFELFPVINTTFTSSLSFLKNSIKEKKLWSKERVVPQPSLLSTYVISLIAQLSEASPPSACS
jgi:hypothetical protein